MKYPSIILVQVSRCVFIFLNILAVYLFLKGHNEPGGGFIAGIATALSFVLISVAINVDELKKILPFEPMKLALAGLLIAYSTCLAPVFFDLPFLFHKMIHLHVPILGDLHVGTPVLFDLGVYFVVIGVSTKIIMVFTEKTEGNNKEELS